ncbi:Oidioi.mRNA.OKI2018_I69.chr2.g7148.t1.cds [Oikopleura dioica]|uniref:Oidioi.mRNA.OKI2018_I69.chr2.g7148.t1.cds n=1 Tax=Oikopleura dioica TaxID=34765 RepID=A0ABN7T8S6_OIKDI|nr:Oidioi.mRNA.OKI2018_I69.chr2.g7148.t1.cds [Oikopleura dioica]
MDSKRLITKLEQVIAQASDFISRYESSGSRTNGDIYVDFSEITSKIENMLDITRDADILIKPGTNNKNFLKAKNTMDILDCSIIFTNFAEKSKAEQVKMKKSTTKTATQQTCPAPFTPCAFCVHQTPCGLVKSDGSHLSPADKGYSKAFAAEINRQKKRLDKDAGKIEEIVSNDSTEKNNGSKSVIKKIKLFFLFWITLPFNTARELYRSPPDSAASVKEFFQDKLATVVELACSLYSRDSERAARCLRNIMASLFNCVVSLFQNTAMRIGIFCFLIRLISPLVNYGITGVLLFILISIILLYMFLPKFDKKKQKPSAQQMYTALESIAKELTTAQDLDLDDESPSDESF